MRRISEPGQRVCTSSAHSGSFSIDVTFARCRTNQTVEAPEPHSHTLSPGLRSRARYEIAPEFHHGWAFSQNAAFRSETHERVGMAWGCRTAMFATWAAVCTLRSSAKRLSKGRRLHTYIHIFPKS